MSYALFVRNAQACENAKHPTCRCACGGRLHGTKHSAEWLERTFAELQNAEELERLRTFVRALCKAGLVGRRP